MKRHLVFFIVVLIVVLQGLSGTVSLAEGDITCSENFVGEKIAVIGGKLFVEPLGGFRVKYILKNQSTQNIAQVEVREALMDSDGNVIPGTESVLQYDGTASGKESVFYGKAFQTGEGGSSYTLAYSVLYRFDGSDEWKELKTGVKTVSVINTQIDVTYKAINPGSVTEGQKVLYTVELKSKANVRLENISVRDNILGELGRIPVLEPGDSVVLTKAFTLEQTTESYVVLAYDDPLGMGERRTVPKAGASVRVEVGNNEPVYSLEVEGQVNKEVIEPGDEVTFVLKLKNTGNVILTGIKAEDWNKKVIYTKEALLPGQEETVEYTAILEPGNQYKITFSAVPQDGGQRVQASYTAQFDKLKPKLEIERTISPERVMAGDTVTFSYVLKNTGDIAVVDVLVEEPQFGEVASFDRLDPGQEKRFSMSQTLGFDAASHPRVMAKDEISGAEFLFSGDLLEIPVQVSSGAPHLSVELSTEPDRLTKAGSVELICTIVNDGGVKVQNIEAFLKERDMVVGSILALEPGEEKTLTVPDIAVDKDESFTVIVKGKAVSGEAVEVTGQPLEVKIVPDEIEETEEKVHQEPAENTESDEKPAKAREDNSILNFLKNLLAVIILLIVLTVGGLVYLIKDTFHSKAKTKKR